MPDITLSQMLEMRVLAAAGHPKSFPTVRNRGEVTRALSHLEAMDEVDELLAEYPDTYPAAVCEVRYNMGLRRMFVRFSSDPGRLDGLQP